MNPETCEILKMYNDQIPSCYVNHLEKCPVFYECLEYLVREGKKKK